MKADVQRQSGIRSGTGKWAIALGSIPEQASALDEAERDALVSAIALQVSHCVMGAPDVRRTADPIPTAVAVTECVPVAGGRLYSCIIGDRIRFKFYPSRNTARNDEDPDFTPPNKPSPRPASADEFVRLVVTEVLAVVRFEKQNAAQIEKHAPLGTGLRAGVGTVEMGAKNRKDHMIVWFEANHVHAANITISTDIDLRSLKRICGGRSFVATKYDDRQGGCAGNKGMGISKRYVIYLSEAVDNHIPVGVLVTANRDQSRYSQLLPHERGLILQGQSKKRRCVFIDEDHANHHVPACRLSSLDAARRESSDIASWRRFTPHATASVGTPCTRLL